MPQKLSIAIVGKGKVGTSLARRIKDMPDYRLFAHLAARKRSFEGLNKNNGPDVIFICSKDDEIARVANNVRKFAGKNLKLMVHCAGSLPGSILVGRTLSPLAGNGRLKTSRTLASLTLHPIQTFTTPDPLLFENIYFMVSSKDAYAKKWARKFVKDIGGIGIIEVRSEDLPLYHTLVVFASNFTILLGRAIEIFSKSLHIKPKEMKKAIRPLMLKSLENVLAGDAKKILTGPIARKDYSTILKHKKALLGQPKALRKIYDGFILLAKE